MKKIFLLFFSFIFSFYSYGQNCVHCMYYQNYMGINPYENTGFQPIYNYYTPWWNQYSMPQYSYYNYPSPWMNYGMDGSYYSSHGGGGMMGKPNLYIYGSNGSKFKISFEFNEKSGLLSAVPRYNKGWEGTISHDGIVSNNAFYRYYYYDYAVDISKFQWKKGKCVKEKDLMEYLNDLLKSGGFNKREIDDFNEYWSYKMPRGDEFCVFPQGNRELDKVAKINVTPAATINRLSFFIVPQIKKKNPALLAKKLPFLRKPLKKWEAISLKKKKNLHINEWGVGWVDEDHYLKN